MTRTKLHLDAAAAVAVAISLAAWLWLALRPGAPGPAAQADAPATSTVTDLLGRKVQVRLPVRRMMLGEGRQLYLLAALDTEDPIGRVVGWRKDLIQSDPDTYATYLRKFPRIAELPQFGGFEDGTFDLELAISLKPDVILMNIESQRATDDARYVQRLQAVGIPIVYVDFRHYPVENTEPTIRLLGQLMGKEARARELIDFRAAQIRRVTDVIEAAAPARPRVFIERIGGYTEDCCLSFGNENFGKFVEMAGGSNLAGKVIRGTFGQVNPEQVLASDPEQVVVTSANWEAFVPKGPWIGVGPGADPVEAARKLRGFTRRAAYEGTAAQRNGAFHAIWHQFYNSPYDFVAIQQLARWLHPDLFADLDADATFRAFHQRFLPVDYAPGYFISLPKEPGK